MAEETSNTPAAERAQLAAVAPRSRLESFFAERVKEVLALFGARLTGYRYHQKAMFLSYANRRRLEMARAMATDAKLLLLDEPSIGLGPIVFENILEVVKKINAQGVAVLIVEQNVAQTLEVANRGYVLEDGFITLEGKSDELRRDERVRRAYLSVE
jgi:branched-chain amino acid transport system ATP-binding protein